MSSFSVSESLISKPGLKDCWIILGRLLSLSVSVWLVYFRFFYVLSMFNDFNEYVVVVVVVCFYSGYMFAVFSFWP